MILGHFSASFLPFFSSILGILSIVSCYYVAIYYHHEKPLPHTWISKTAQHYPEFIIFRLGTISNGVLMILSYFMNHFYLKTVCYEHIVNLNKYKPKLTLFLGTLGVFALFVNTATIDTGKMNEKLHVACAGSFFLLTILACLYNTFVYSMIYLEKKRVIGSWALVAKLVLSAALILQAYLDVTSQAFYSYEAYKSSNLAHYLEFTLAFTVLGYFFVMGFDLKGYQMVYKSKS